MASNRLMVLIEAEDLNSDVLAGFPYLLDQFSDGYEDNEVADTDQVGLVVNLGDHADTTTAQEQYLDSRDEVIEYCIV